MRSAFMTVADYLYSLGVNRSNIRLAAYLDFLSSIDSDEPMSMTAERGSRLWREIYEIMWVAMVFRDNKVEPPRELIVKALNGKPLEEYDNDLGRSTFLELRAAIYLLKAGYAISLGQDCDLIGIKRKERLFVECKRLYSEKKARERVRECYRQLERRLHAADSSFKNRAIGWVDPSPAIQARFSVYMGYAEHTVRRAVQSDLVYFWEKWISKAYEGKERRIYALVLQAVWCGWIPSGGGLRTGFSTYVVPSHGRVGILDLIRTRRLLDRIITIENDELSQFIKKERELDREPA